MASVGPRGAVVGVERVAAAVAASSGEDVRRRGRGSAGTRGRAAGRPGCRPRSRPAHVAARSSGLGSRRRSVRRRVRRSAGPGPVARGVPPVLSASAVTTEAATSPTPPAAHQPRPRTPTADAVAARIASSRSPGSTSSATSWSRSLISVAHDASSHQSPSSSRRAALPRCACALTEPRRDAERVGDLRLRPVQVVPQHEHLALPLGELEQRLSHGVAAGAADRRPVDGRPRRARCPRVPLDDDPVPQRRAGAVHHGLAQVGERLVGVAQPRPLAVHRDEGVLDDVLGGRLVVHEQDREPDELAPVGGVQLLDGGVGVGADEARGGPARAPSLDGVWSGWSRSGTRQRARPVDGYWTVIVFVSMPGRCPRRRRWGRRSRTGRRPRR